MCGLRTRPRTDLDPPRVELPSAGAYRLAAPEAIPCYAPALSWYNTNFTLFQIKKTRFYVFLNWHFKNVKSGSKKFSPQSFEVSLQLHFCVTSASEMTYTVSGGALNSTQTKFVLHLTFCHVLLIICLYCG